MHRPINPWIDCVFRELFGAEENCDLLLDLVNAVLEPSLTLHSLEITSPVAPEEFVGDNFTVVDVKGRDEGGRVVQLELQLQVRRMLPERMLYTWSDLYHLQLQRGERHFQLRPVISIWILGERLFPAEAAWHHTFELRAGPLRLTDHLRIDVIELPKWSGRGSPRLVRWLRFLREASTWEELPHELDDPHLRKAMAVLQRWSEKEIAYLRYQDRMNAIREQNAWIEEMEFRKSQLDAKASEVEAKASEVEAKAASVDAKAASVDAKAASVDAKAASVDAKARELERRAEALQAEAERIEQAREQLLRRLRSAGIDPERL